VANRPGRPTKFTPEVRAIILEAIEAGNYFNVAASVAGVSYKVFREWVRRGASDAPDDAQYRAFRLAVKRAEAEAHRKMLEHVTTAAPTTWQAAAWYLERKYPKQWARRDPDPTPSDLSNLTDAQLEDIASGKGRR
jgi:transposase